MTKLISSGDLKIRVNIEAESEGFKEEMEGKIVLRGCVVMPGAPNWFCGSCEYEWSDPNSL